MKKITKWYKVTRNKNGEPKFEFNHISDGWEKSDYPSAFKNEYTNQLAWKNGEWSKQFKYMNDNYQIVDELNYAEAFDLAFSQKHLWSEALQHRFIYTRFLKPVQDRSHFVIYDQITKVSSFEGELVYDLPNKYNVNFNSEEKKYNKFNIEKDEDYFGRMNILHQLGMI